MAKNRPKKANYWRASRSLAVSYVFIVPLLALYEIGVLFQPEVRNGTDPILRGLFDRFGSAGMLSLELCYLVLLLVSIARARQVRVGRPDIYGMMFAESILWSGGLFIVAQVLHNVLSNLQLAISGFLPDTIAAAGAGVYEEIIFRFAIMGGTIQLLRRVLGATPGWAVAFALPLSAGLFSWAHHGIGGEVFTYPVFFFRAVMGVILGAIYLTRGLGLTVYTHALYNVLVSLVSEGADG
ncbi:MAG: CPBP family intramembrane glutamic endopeptidase [Planctomycetota bacterium]